MTINTRLACSLFILLLLLAQGTTLASSEVVRLHVIANSDSLNDQQLKEAVRDQIIAELGPLFAELEQKDVIAWLQRNRNAVWEVAESVLKERQAPYSARVRFGVEDYPLRAYRAAVYPGGKYKSVQVVLGEGQGRNWWCLLFPPLCFVKETVTPAAQTEQNVKVGFWFWEQICSFCQKIFGL